MTPTDLLKSTTERLEKAKLPVGHVSTHRDGSKHKKVGPGKWEQVEAGKGQAKAEGGAKKKANLAQLSSKWRKKAKATQKGADPTDHVENLVAHEMAGGFTGKRVTQKARPSKGMWDQHNEHRRAVSIHHKNLDKDRRQKVIDRHMELADQAEDHREKVAHLFHAANHAHQAHREAKNTPVWAGGDTEGRKKDHAEHTAKMEALAKELGTRHGKAVKKQQAAERKAEREKKKKAEAYRDQKTKEKEAAQAKAKKERSDKLAARSDALKAATNKAQMADYGAHEQERLHRKGKKEAKHGDLKGTAALVANWRHAADLKRKQGRVHGDEGDKEGHLLAQGRASNMDDKAMGHTFQLTADEHEQLHAHHSKKAAEADHEEDKYFHESHAKGHARKLKELGREPGKSKTDQDLDTYDAAKKAAAKATVKAHGSTAAGGKEGDSAAHHHAAADAHDKAAKAAPKGTVARKHHTKAAKGHKAAAKANEASERAQRSGMVGDHEAAAEAHREAAKHHDERTQRRGFHEGKAREHEKDAAHEADIRESNRLTRKAKGANEYVDKTKKDHAKGKAKHGQLDGDLAVIAVHREAAFASHQKARYEEKSGSRGTAYLDKENAKKHEKAAHARADLPHLNAHDHSQLQRYHETRAREEKHPEDKAFHQRLSDHHKGKMSDPQGKRKTTGGSKKEKKAKTKGQMDLFGKSENDMRTPTEILGDFLEKAQYRSKHMGAGGKMVYVYDDHKARAGRWSDSAHHGDSKGKSKAERVAAHSVAFHSHQIAQAHAPDEKSKGEHKAAMDKHRKARAQIQSEMSEKDHEEAFHHHAEAAGHAQNDDHEKLFHYNRAGSHARRLENRGREIGDQAMAKKWAPNAQNYTRQATKMADKVEWSKAMKKSDLTESDLEKSEVQTTEPKSWDEYVVDHMNDLDNSRPKLQRAWGSGVDLSDIPRTAQAAAPEPMTKSEAQQMAAYLVDKALIQTYRHQVTLQEAKNPVEAALLKSAHPTAKVSILPEQRHQLGTSAPDPIEVVRQAGALLKSWAGETPLAHQALELAEINEVTLGHRLVAMDLTPEKIILGR